MYATGWHYCGKCGEWRKPISEEELRCDECGCRIRKNAARANRRMVAVKRIE